MLGNMILMNRLIATSEYRPSIPSIQIAPSVKKLAQIEAYAGRFDGRGFRIKNWKNATAGLFKVVGEGAVVAAGALVLGGTIIGEHEIWGGVPAKFIKKTKPDQAESYAAHYVAYTKWYLAEDNK